MQTNQIYFDGRNLRTQLPAGSYDQHGRWHTSERRAGVDAEGRFNASTQSQLDGYGRHIMNGVQDGTYQSGFGPNDFSGRAQDDTRQAGVNGNDANKHWESLKNDVRAFARGDRAAGVRLANDLALALSETGSRTGFTASILKVVDDPDAMSRPYKIPIRHKQIFGHVATTSTSLSPARWIDKYTTPSVVEAKANAKTSVLNARQNPGDTLGDMLDQCYEQIVVQEDKLLLEAGRRDIGVIHDEVGFPVLQPSHWVEGTIAILEHSVNPARTTLMAANLWNDISGAGGGTNEWDDKFSPVEKYELMVDGRIGVVKGTAIITDGFRQQHLQVLERDTLVMYGAPENVGGMINYGPIETKPTDYASVDGENAIGHIATKYFSMIVFGAAATIYYGRS